MKRSKLSLPDWEAGAYGTPSVAKKGEGGRGETRAKKNPWGRARTRGVGLAELIVALLYIYR